MRIWSRQLIPYLSDFQFRGQLRELVLILHDWRDRGATNHLLINRVMEYPKSDLTAYFLIYRMEYIKRYGKDIKPETIKEFVEFADNARIYTNKPFEGWHNLEYLRICYANLLEKHNGVGKSRITDEEWQLLLDGYKEITGEEYKI